MRMKCLLVLVLLSMSASGWQAPALVSGSKPDDWLNAAEGTKQILFTACMASIATMVFLGGHALFFRTKAGKAYRRKLGKQIAGPERGK